MSSTQVPPWACDPQASTPVEKRLAERYQRATRDVRAERLEDDCRELLLQSLKHRADSAAWAADCLRDVPEVLASVRLTRLLFSFLPFNVALGLLARVGVDGDLRLRELSAQECERAAAMLEALAIAEAAA